MAATPNEQFIKEYLNDEHGMDYTAREESDRIRHEFAESAMQSLIRAGWQDRSPWEIAAHSVKIADALLVCLEEDQGR